MRFSNRKNAAAATALVEARANLDDRLDFGGTALHLACRQNLPTVIDQMLQVEANVHAPDSEGDLPLHVAAAYGSVTSVRLLLAASARVRAENLRLESALTTAVGTGAQSGVVAVLMPVMLILAEVQKCTSIDSIGDGDKLIEQNNENVFEFKTDYRIK
jgi:ankyrin repeat protein